VRRIDSTSQHGGDCSGNGISCIYDEGLDIGRNDRSSLALFVDAELTNRP